ncbi:dihydrodipicolinate reductase [Nitrincola nitratireducens]|uniref:Dihydrodipicolinate reductase n=1 Tax=Nitrincola nitratireducens TaxID=1229521 RepID=W9UQI0_9GAMM|nr:dihydrodipicolinate reductase [Nitrincola nitratireducens]
MIKIAVTGAAGRMGKTLIEAVTQAEGVTLLPPLLNRAVRCWEPMLASWQVLVSSVLH